MFLGTAYSQLGIRGGLNVANTTIKSLGLSISPESKIGFHIGATYDIAVNEDLTLRPAVLYSTKGFKFTAFEDFTTSSNYLEVPINIVYNIGDGANGLFLQGGPYLGFLLSANSEGEEISDELKSADFGANLGLGYNLNANFSAGVDYSLGLANILNGVEEGETMTNKNFSVYILYRL